MQHGIGTGPFSKRIQDRFGVPMFSQFVGAEMIAEKYQFRKGGARRLRARQPPQGGAAHGAGPFADEIVALPVTGEDGETASTTATRASARCHAGGHRSVKLLKEGGKISAANASQICDGASGVLVVSERALKEHGLTPLARVVNLTSPPAIR
jgi:acetyl-CoA C-acetyltransferase